MKNYTQEELNDIERDLAECPFCGGDPESGVVMLTNDDEGFWVDCQCGASIGPRNTPETVAYQWEIRFTRPV